MKDNVDFLAVLDTIGFDLDVAELVQREELPDGAAYRLGAVDVAGRDIDELARWLSDFASPCGETHPPLPRQRARRRTAQSVFLKAERRSRSSNGGPRKTRRRRRR